jgi:hypothetical protein
MKKDPHDAGLAKLAFLLPDLPELQGPPEAVETFPPLRPH